MSITWLVDDLILRHAAQFPDDPAIIDDTATLTWAGLERRSAAVAMAVGAALDGIEPSEHPRVALVAGASADMAAALVGILRAGAKAAPVPTGLTARELATALDVLHPSLVLHDGSRPDAARPAADADDAAPRPWLRIDAIPDTAMRIAPRPTRDLAMPAVVVLTSGTTGRPKGVVLSGAALAASADAWMAVLPPATGWALPLGLAHVAGLGVLWRAILQRVPVRILPATDTAALLAALREPAPGTPPLSHVSLVPTQLVRLLDAAAEAGGDAPPPATLRAVPLGGGVVPPALVLRATAAGWPIVPTYGLSECGSGVTALPAAEAAEAPDTAGRPLPGFELSIDHPDPDGVGEIVVRSPSAFLGYLGEPRRELGEPIRTGDLGRLDAKGRLIVVDRRTDRIVRGGENIDPSEVEAALTEHPAVADAAVVGRSDEMLGQVPVAAIVFRPGAADPGDEVLAAHVRARLAGFKVPVAFARLDALPRTAGGKLRREAVRPLVTGGRAGELARPGGDAIGWRVTGDGPRQIVLLHGTLSTAGQLDRFARMLAVRLDATIHAIDRRGSGSSRLADPHPLNVALHVADLIAYLDARGIDSAAFVGVSFGAGLALETAARHPERVSAVAAYEPPYGAVGGPEIRAQFAKLAAAVESAHRTAGAPAAAETFLRAVAGDEAWDRLPARSRAFLEGEGDGALADAGLTGLDPDGLARITAPTLILTGSASEPFYAPIADALAQRIPGARRATLDGLTHTSPIVAPADVAEATAAFLHSLEPTP
jgi:O-succinylbenzoic acid--CoA ligase